MIKHDALDPLVSVIVTTRNEERNIGNCLRSIQLQTYKNIEIIVVDNNSTDGTQEIARSFTDAVVNKGPERSAQRNHGICDLATGKFAMFIDADMILTPTLIESCVIEIQRTQVMALHIYEIVLGKGVLASVRRFERSFYSGTVIDGARFFSRDLFCAIKGFDEDLLAGPEDWDLDKKIKNFGMIGLLSKGNSYWDWEFNSFVGNRGVLHDPKYVGLYHNEADQNLMQYLKKKMYYSPSMVQYRSKWSQDDQDIRKQLGIRYRYFSVFVESGKWKKILQEPHLFSVLLLLRILVGCGYLFSRGIKNESDTPTRQ